MNTFNDMYLFYGTSFAKDADGEPVLRQGVTIGYTYPTAVGQLPYAHPNQLVGFVALTPEQTLAAEMARARWSDVANITWVAMIMYTQFKWLCIQRSTTGYLNIRWPTTLFGGPRFQVTFIIWLLAALPAAWAAETTPLNKLSTYMFKMIVYGIGDNISYSVEAYDGGTVEYQGFEFVKTKGRVRFQIDSEALANLRTDFESIGFFGFDSVYQETPSFAYRTKREVLFEMRFGEKLKSVTYYRLQGTSAAWKKKRALLEASRLRIPLTDLLCPYVVPWPDTNAGMELCSGRPIISRDEWAERLRQCMTNSSGNETVKYISCSSQQMYTERELQERLNK